MTISEMTQEMEKLHEHLKIVQSIISGFEALPDVIQEQIDSETWDLFTDCERDLIETILDLDTREN